MAAALILAPVVAPLLMARRVAAQQPPSVTEAAAPSQPVVIRGGWLFTGTSDQVIRNPGILVVAGKLAALGDVASNPAARDAYVLRLTDRDYILPGFFDLHAHYSMQIFGPSRFDEYRVNPILFLANGVTSTFPAGEMNPGPMHLARLRIERGQQIGPRIWESGPYFGSARPGWNRYATVGDIADQVDFWAERGVRNFKAKHISPKLLRALIERAHMHGATVTGHLDSGYRNSVNPRDAILMGIDRIEHFLGGADFSPDSDAYKSLVNFSPSSPGFRDIVRLYIKHHVYFDATISAYGYYGARDPRVFTKWTDEMQYLTPYARAQVRKRLPWPVSQQFERIYRAKLKTARGFYDAGGGSLMTLGTDHPSWGEFLPGFCVHRELLALHLAGIPNAAVLRMATINGARALGVGDHLGSIETGKWADLVVVHGNPLTDIRNTRHTEWVMKGGELYDTQKLLRSVVGKLGPTSAPDAN